MPDYDEAYLKSLTIKEFLELSVEEQQQVTKQIMLLSLNHLLTDLQILNKELRLMRANRQSQIEDE